MSYHTYPVTQDYRISRKVIVPTRNGFAFFSVPFSNTIALVSGCSVFCIVEFIGFAAALVVFFAVFLALLNVLRIEGG